MDACNSYVFSIHALQRKAERFSEMTINELIIYAEHSKVAKNSIKKRIGDACPCNFKLHHKGAFVNRYYLYNNKKKIVFVIGDGNVIITLFKWTQ